MAEMEGKCTNFRNCNIADEKQVVTAQEMDFVCPKCGKKLVPIPKKRPPIPKRLVVAGGIVLIAALAIAGFLWLYDPAPDEPPLPPDSPPATQPPPTPEPPPDTQQPPAPEPAPAPVAVDPSQIEAQLVEGHYAAAAALLQEDQSQNPAVSSLRQQFQTPARLTVQFQHKAPGRPNPPPETVASNRQLPVTLTHKDNYRIYLANTGNQDLYVHAFQKDHYGKIHRLFPDPVFSPMGNPLGPGQNIRMPSDDNDWFYLDELSSGETGPISETIIVIACPWKADDINRLFGRIHEATQGVDRQQALREFLQRLKRRDDASVPASFYREFSFMHGR